MLGTSTTAMQTIQSKPQAVVVSGTSSGGGWPILRTESSSSLGNISAVATSSTAIMGDNDLGLNRISHHNGSLTSVGQSIASQSTVRLTSGDHNASQNIQIN